ncbi:MAG TPA: ribonuclease T2 [Paracoccus solventivorans]|uniref:Ribonuclease T2 n=1 Tax=Paracoccus solventivorans TaxID=53463 RepID=A0A832QWN0_9RHOB|nr:ribonuclease T2 [Paracoccus solventivorans]HHW32805.1 ribonuclease T2 [Paracoccus solventivorans]
MKPRLLRALICATLMLPLPAAAEDVAGRFDYYVLSLSWSPSWCASEGGDAPQCDPRRRTGFVVHGLWPQYERGWPDFCTTAQRDPTRGDSRGMEALMGSAGLAWYQWQKHGRCSGLSGPDYYRATSEAAAAVAIPPVLARLPRNVRLGAAVIEDAFIEANPDLTRDGITVTCKEGRLQEVRICLTRELEPRNCGPDVRRDCRTPMLVEAP